LHSLPYVIEKETVYAMNTFQVEALKGWCLRKEETAPEVTVPASVDDKKKTNVRAKKPRKKQAPADPSARDLRPKQSLSAFLRSKVPSNMTTLPKETVFQETVKYIKKFLPDANKVGKISTTKNEINIVTSKHKENTIC
jgi:hypothetical protein